MDDAFVARAVQRDHGVCLPAAVGEVVFRAAQIAQPFFARRGHEFDRMQRLQPRAVDLGGQRQHHGEPSAVIVDPRADETCTIAPNGEIRLAWKDRVEMRTDDHGRQSLCAVATANDVACLVGVDL